MSLKSELLQTIADKRGEIFSLNEMNAFCERRNNKPATGERRLREAVEDEYIKVFKNKKKHITGYSL